MLLRTTIGSVVIPVLIYKNKWFYDFFQIYSQIINSAKVFVFHIRKRLSLKYYFEIIKRRW